MERELRMDLTEISKQVHFALNDTFGLPDHPTWPLAISGNEKYAILADEKSLARAAGPVGRGSDLVEVGLFRKQCAQCHGISGNGYGPTAALLDPYPRDFRRGTFKYKNVSFGQRPALDDLIHTIEHGISGTSMPAMKNLKRSKHYDEDIPVLAKYVRFLAIRGEVERELMLDTSRDLEPGEILYDQSQSQTNPQNFKNNQARIDEVIRRVTDRWLADPAAERAEKESESPFQRFVTGKRFAQSDLFTESTDGQVLDLQKSIERGRTLFIGSAACSQCHGKDGKGDPKWQDFDEWTKDWTIRAGIDPKKTSEWKPLKKLGLLKPVVASPRNLTLGVFRGQPTPIATSDSTVRPDASRLSILRAVLNGIEGSPMPAAAIWPDTAGGMTDDQIMDLVRYVELLSRSQAQAETSNQEPETEGTNKL